MIVKCQDMVEETTVMKFWHFKKLSILSVHLYPSTTTVLNYYKLLKVLLVENYKFLATEAVVILTRRPLYI